MMSEGPEQTWRNIKARIEKAKQRFGDVSQPVELIAVSKTFDSEDIAPLLDVGQRIFGENRVQEARQKWPDLKQRYDGVELHLIGPLQTNKVRDAVELFDYIHSVDREKLAAKLRSEMDRAGCDLPCFIQVNIGAEPQKAGVAVDHVAEFVDRCTQEHKLNIVGLMAIPPANVPPGPYFAQLAVLARASGLEKLSMGMSADFEIAIGMGATHIRVGSALFGQRPKPAAGRD